MPHARPDLHLPPAARPLRGGNRGRLLVCCWQQANCCLGGGFRRCRHGCCWCGGNCCCSGVGSCRCCGSASSLRGHCRWRGCDCGCRHPGRRGGGGGCGGGGDGGGRRWWCFTGCHFCSRSCRCCGRSQCGQRCGRCRCRGDGCCCGCGGSCGRRCSSLDRWRHLRQAHLRARGNHWRGGRSHHLHTQRPQAHGPVFQRCRLRGRRHHRSQGPGVHKIVFHRVEHPNALARHQH